MNNGKKEKRNTQKSYEELAFIEVLNYVEEALQSSMQVAPYVKLSEVKQYYCQVLEGLNAEFISVNATRLKEKLLQMNPNLEATPHNKEIFLSYKDDLAAALKYSEEHNADSDLKNIIATSRMIRKEIFEVKQQFDGSFRNECQVDAVPHSLLVLINLIIGFNPSQIDDHANQKKVGVSIAQLLQFNTVKKKSDASRVRHNIERETPLAIYIALLLHSSTRSRTLIDKFHSLGLCISYDRMLSISTALANSVCDQFDREVTLCPPLLRQNVFSTFAVDNIDHNPSSRTAKESWHGTAISATQHVRSKNDRIVRERTSLKFTDDNQLKQLPSSYINVKPFLLQSTDVFAPTVEVRVKSYV